MAEIVKFGGLANGVMNYQIYTPMKCSTNHTNLIVSEGVLGPALHQRSLLVLMYLSVRERTFDGIAIPWLEIFADNLFWKLVNGLANHQIRLQ